MTTTALVLLILLFFITSAVGVVTGSNSLVTVPVMFQFGIPPQEAVATNMFGLTFMAIGATIPFLGKGVIDRRRMPKMVALTLIGSVAGAALVGLIPGNGLKIIVSVSMIVVTIFTLWKREAGVAKAEKISSNAILLAYALTFLLGVYGGLYSGGYVTMLTACFVAFFGMTFTEAVANTKLINVFSSAAASAVFAYQGLIDYKIGIILAVTMFVAAYVGAKTVTKLNDVWLKRIFISTVLILAAKTIFDFAFVK
ncbi:MAG: sulfite exporter TauE/SafE family protein [Acidobacteriota bacterium]|nr:sulfite exporter TauE/SafE family protein [Acidobacteriota bacterium]